MPKGLAGHEMVRMDKDLAVIGGYGGGYSSSLYRLTCTNKACTWQTMTQELTIGRSNFVAMLIPDELTECSKTHFFRLLAFFYKSVNV